jgi:hypothetical protein
MHAGEIITIHSLLKERPGEKLEQVRHRQNALIGAFEKGLPVADVLFRPEEIHGASGIAQVFKPFPERHGHAGHVSRGFIIQDRPVPDDHPERFAAIETGEIHSHCLARE